MPSFKPEERERLLSALKTLTTFVETTEVSKSCLSCLHWDKGVQTGGEEDAARTGPERRMPELGLGWRGVLTPCSRLPSRSIAERFSFFSCHAGVVCGLR